jgi:hypothetical protein
MIRRISLAFLALIMGLVGSVALAPAHAQAWSYCTNAYVVEGSLNFYNLQGYCGGRASLNPNNYTPGVCYPLDGLNDYAGALYNAHNTRTIIVHSSPACGGIMKIMGPNTSDPDLYPEGLYHAVSSVRFGSP